MRSPPIMPSCCTDWRRYVALVVACAAVAIAGSIQTFPAFSDDMKDDFSLTQSQVEWIASMGFIGASMGYPAGMIHEVIGTKGTFIMALIFGGGASFSFYGSSLNAPVVSTYWPILLFLWMAYGFACVNMYLVSTKVSVNNFSVRNRGLIVGLTGTFYWIGPSAICLIYDVQFMDDPVGNFFIFLGSFMTVGNILAYVFVRYYSSSDEENENKPLLRDVPVFVPNTEGPESLYEKLGFNHFFLPSFQLLIWGYLAGCAVDNMFIFNIGTFVSSYEYAGLGEGLPVVGPFLGGIATLCGGFLSDRTIKKTSRLTYIMAGTSLQALLLLFMIGFGDNFYLFGFTTLVIYCNNGFYWSIIPTLMAEYFGMRHYIRNLGVGLMVKSFVALAWCGLLGLIYEMNISTPDTTVCTGQSCFQVTFVLIALSSVVSVGLFSRLRALERRQTCQQENGSNPSSLAG